MSVLINSNYLHMEKEQLQQKLKELAPDLEIDKRWGVKKLQETIALYEGGSVDSSEESEKTDYPDPGKDEGEGTPEPKADLPKGRAKKLTKSEAPKDGYKMVRRVKHNGTLYEVGQHVELDGEMEELFTRMGFVESV